MAQKNFNQDLLGLAEVSSALCSPVTSNARVVGFDLIGMQIIS